MMSKIKIFSTMFLFFLIQACNAQQKEENIIAYCRDGKGCEFYKTTQDRNFIDRLIGKSSFFAAAPESSILIINKCESFIDSVYTVAEIQKRYGVDKPVVYSKEFNIQEYFKRECGLVTYNKTKRIAFRITTEGEVHNGYFFLNINKGEAFVPFEGYAGVNQLDPESNIRVDAVITDRQLTNYVIADGKKYKQVMDVGLTFGPSLTDAAGRDRFKNDFIKTGEKGLFLEKDIAEVYRGRDDEGNTLDVWLTPVANVRLLPGQFSCIGLYNVGYIAKDNSTYLITKLIGNGLVIEITGITDEEYTFNPSGYGGV